MHMYSLRLACCVSIRVVAAQRKQPNQMTNWVKAWMMALVACVHAFTPHCVAPCFITTFLLQFLWCSLVKRLEHLVLSVC